MLVYKCYQSLQTRLDSQFVGCNYKNVTPIISVKSALVYFMNCEKNLSESK